MTMQEEIDDIKAHANDMITTVKAQRDSSLDAVMQLEAMIKARDRESAKLKAKIAELEAAAVAANDDHESDVTKHAANVNGEELHDH